MIRRTEIHVKGKAVAVPTIQLCDRTLITTGKWFKVAAVRHEDLLDGETVIDPESFVKMLKESALKADIFTFAQRIPSIERRYTYCTKWENVAAVETTSFVRWWKEIAEYSIRKAVNRSKKHGVKVKVVEFSDDFVEETCPIYNETPVRQGKAFWHFGKDFKTIKDALDTYVDRSSFIGAYLEGKLIGFMKITWVGPTGTITQILSLQKHFDKRPNNAMIARAVELCESLGKSHLIYGSYVYFDPNSSLTEFKRRNGFESIPLPRYYIPLTLKGRVILGLGLHRSMPEIAPKPLFRLFLKTRKMWAEHKLKRLEPAEQSVND
jgi:hypothetical protein